MTGCTPIPAICDCQQGGSDIFPSALPDTVKEKPEIIYVDRIEYVDRWHEPVTVNQTIVVYEEVRVPEYPHRNIHTVKEFNKILYDSMSVPLFNYWDNQKYPDCDNYALQAVYYGDSKGYRISWQHVDRDLYDKIFQGQLTWASQNDAHFIVGTIIDSDIYFADYTYPIFTEEGEISRAQRWFIVKYVPLD